VSAAPYTPDRRAEEEARRELSVLAGATPLPRSLDPAGTGTWHDLLFDGERLADPSEASQALLAGVARAQATLWRHYDALPGRARREWLGKRLGITARESIPDRVLVVVEGDPKRLPRTVGPGAVLKAKDAAGLQRRYRTLEALRVTGAQVAGVHSYRVLDDGRDVIGRGRDHAGEAVGAFHPFGTEADAPAPHELYVASELLRFETGTLSATLELHGVSFPGLATAAEGMHVLRQLEWWISRADKPVRAAAPAVANAGSGKVVLSFALAGGAAPYRLGAAEQTWLRASWPATGEFAADLALALRFTHATLTVRGAGARPAVGAFNDGLLDLTKEFEPFGPVPRRGDAFYIRSDEAFAKPLTALTVTLDALSGTELKGAPYHDISREQVRKVLEYVAGQFGRAKTDVTDARVDEALRKTEAAREVAWQAHRAGLGWQTLGRPVGSFETVTLHPASSAPVSDPAEVAGISGRFVRAFLSQGDFGWRGYQDDLAANAALAAGGKAGSVKKVMPPEPPVLRGVTLAYTSAPAATSAAARLVRLLARNGLGEPVELGGGPDISPFVQDPGGHRGTMYLGLGDVPLGEVLSLYVEIDEAAACSALDRRADFAWEYRSEPDGEWRALRVLDGTRGLRHTGIVRLVAPVGWAEGAPEAAEGHGRWLRARTDKPGLSGIIRRILTDAVEAVYELAAATDPLPATALPTAGVTGFAQAVVGVKKASNPAPSWGGRAAEADADLFARGADTVRHRGRAISAWDVERLVLERFPEVGKVRCLPHHSPSSECAPGWMGVVVVRRTEERLPHPSVRLAGEIEEWLGARATPHARVAVLCPELVEVSVAATIQLRAGVPAGDAAERIEAELRKLLHPWLTTREGADWGVSLYRSSLVAFLETLDEVDFVGSLSFHGLPAGTERLDTDPCRGLIASAELHRLSVEAAL
jgi:Baseplate J-like protein